LTLVFIIAVLLVSIYEIYKMKKSKMKKEIYVYIVMAAITLVFGILYLPNMYKVSFGKFLV
jgi:multisubunit Na+/H+ antiporter MnhB subunit